MDYQNLLQIFENTCQKRQSHACIQFAVNGAWHTLNWLEVRTRVQAVAEQLQKQGIAHGERVAILSKTRYEWTIADLAILAVGGVTVPIYDSNTPAQIEFILQNSGARMIFVENVAQLQKLQRVWQNLPELRLAVLFEAPQTVDSTSNIFSFHDWASAQNPSDAVYTKGLTKIVPTDIASIVYTSGTSGEPKGAVVTHDGLIAATVAGRAVFHFRPDSVNLMLLPLSHILGRITQFYHLDNGFLSAYAESLDRLADNIQTVKPHFMVCVPRIFEKFYDRAMQAMPAAGTFKRKIFDWGYAVGRAFSAARMRGEAAGLGLRFKNAIAKKLVFAKLKNRLGGRFEFAVSGGAPLSAEIGTFFQAFGVVILEGYGLTETCAANCVNRFDATKMGTVGKPLPGVEIKIAPDGEILIRGRVVFREYFQNPQATADVFGPDRWFHSGDIGEFDSDGFLKITDRKKDIIVTAGGKKVAPQNLENLLKTDPLISQAMVHGDRRKFLSALVTLNTVELEAFAQKSGIRFANTSELLQHPSVRQKVEQTIAEKNKTLASYETIKKFAILPVDFSVATGDLTPTLKIRRKEITQKYKTILDGFYAE